MAAAAAANHSHRAGKLKQQNKRNKRSVSSKRSVSRKSGGKIQSLGVGGSKSRRKGVKQQDNVLNRNEARANRINEAKQRRIASRKNVWNAHRFGGGASSAVDVGVGASSIGGSNNNSTSSLLARAISNKPPPRIIGIISLSEIETELEEQVRSCLIKNADNKIISSNSNNSSSSVTVSYNIHSKNSQPNLTLLTNSTSFKSQYYENEKKNKYNEEDASVQSSLDLCRICDLVLFLIDGRTAVLSSSSSNSQTSGSGAQGSSDTHSLYGASVTSMKTSNTTAHLDHLISDRGDRILSAIRGQGLPTPVTVIVHQEQDATNNSSENETGGSSVVLGRNIGTTEAEACSTKAINELNDTAMQDSDNEDEEEDMDDEDCITSLASTFGGRSMKSIKRTYLRKRSELKRYISRLAMTEFGNDCSKVLELDIIDGDELEDDKSTIVASAAGASSARSVATSSAISATTTSSKLSQTSISALVRTLCTISASGPNWVADAARPYLVSDGSIIANNHFNNSSLSKMVNMPPVKYDETTKELSLTGYIRGNTPWNVNQLVHVPHLGTFGVKNIKLAGVNVVNGNKEEEQLSLPPIVAAGRKVRRVKSTGGDKDMEDVSSADKKNDNSNDQEGGGGMILAECNPEERESLDMFASPDALEGEQNLIGFDDDDDDGINEEDGDVFDVDALDNNNTGVKQQQQDSTKKSTVQFQPGTSRPAGWSDYQSAWLDALDEDDEANVNDEDRGELAFALNKKSNNDVDTLMGDHDDDDGGVNAEEKRALLAQRKRDAQSDSQFPDEVDYEEETSARDRYARYRALKSFRKSYWDPKENLPESYGAVYHFSSFKATQRDVLDDVKGLEEVVMRRGWGVGVGRGGGNEGVGGKSGEDDVDMEQDSDDEEEEELARACVPPGAYVTITLENVPPSAYASLSPSTLLTAVSLLPHENKVSVLHMGLTHSSKSEHDAEIPIKSKDVLTFRCGWRTWQSRPVFSQHNLNSDKHKFERYMPTGGGGTYFAASVFGPVTYAPCPVLMFREAAEGTTEDIGGSGSKREFLAHGSMLGADADRIVLKRIILTGYPTRVHKRHATVKYMFYNPEDVKWFMPAGITTKHGLQGNIIQSVGDHGVMKCLFNAPIKQHDTVCLPLYKRVFPKFAPLGKGEHVEEGGEGMFRVL